MIRFVNSEGKDYLPRRDQLFTVAQILPRMKATLAKAKKKSNIISLIEPELASPSMVALSQYCFWTGELAIGGIEGVIKTEAGWLNGKEVTLVSYDKSVVSESEVVKQAKAQSCANDVYRGEALKSYRAARQSDQKRQLQGTKFASIKDLTPFQKTKLNAFARTNLGKAMSYLTPSQKAAL